jgi:hypothetical protein
MLARRLARRRPIANRDGAPNLARGRAGWAPCGRYRELMREAIDNLHAVVVTLRSVNVLSGERERTLRSKVHILEAVVDHEQVQLSVTREW